jgi:hypothetical protein
MGGRYGTIVMHAAVAGGFFFFLQRYGLHQSMETSLLWAAVFAAVAAVLAWTQGRR